MCTYFPNNMFGNSSDDDIVHMYELLFWAKYGDGFTSVTAFTFCNNNIRIDSN